jgi:predicted Mrr-cat superfamily restriction endonuclease
MVGIGWALVGDVRCLASVDAIRDTLREAYPGIGAGVVAGQLDKFANAIQPGDYILTPERATKRVFVSRCTGSYRYTSTPFGEGYPHVRPIKYLGAVKWLSFPQAIRYTLTSSLTVFRADAALPYIDDSIMVC